ncbi:hypothetical protein C9374_000628 [Naegleria lovaniensis]|uniref:Uncharacterized protein n=1 Tax=Naegleria lovaniensis TaxID=51637 RepID=A0AA88KNW3_NAELO|nr:uncharacterized protein C9374_000628 [Naegleria lovaniensis]KAG2388464.1 hypothetical protein C9374_000628 [Naegleria lovaniensis]
MQENGSHTSPSLIHFTVNKKQLTTIVLVSVVGILLLTYLLIYYSLKNRFPHQLPIRGCILPKDSQEKSTSPPRKKNRMAVILSGAIRAFPKVYLFIRNSFFARNEYPDLYISLVYKDSESELGAYNQMKRYLKNVKYESVEFLNMTRLTERVKHLYPDFPFPREKCKEFLTYEGCHNWISSLSLFRNGFVQMKSYNDKMMQEHKLTTNYYDLVFRLRTDILFEQNIDLLHFNVEFNKFYTSQLYYWEGFNDQIGFGSIQVMESYSTLLYHINAISAKEGSYNPERFLKYHLTRKHAFQFLPISYRVVRSIDFASHTRETRAPFDDFTHATV